MRRIEVLEALSYIFQSYAGDCPGEAKHAIRGLCDAMASKRGLSPSFDAAAAEVARAEGLVLDDRPEAISTLSRLATRLWRAELRRRGRSPDPDRQLTTRTIGCTHKCVRCGHLWGHFFLAGPSETRCAEWRRLPKSQRLCAACSSSREPQDEAPRDEQ